MDMDPAVCDAMIQCLELRQKDPELAKHFGHYMHMECMKKRLLDNYFAGDKEQYRYFLRIMASMVFGGNDEKQRLFRSRSCSWKTLFNLI
jgi:hypothetical protein